MLIFIVCFFAVIEQIPILDVCSCAYPVARSQARRILARLEEFKTVELDFEGVEEIGQEFADEMFRVFPSRYPGTELVPVNASETVMRMVKHVRSPVLSRERSEWMTALASDSLSQI